MCICIQLNGILTSNQAQLEDMGASASSVSINEIMDDLVVYFIQ
ncbi:hypothetical protein VRK_01770 [Vibrio sp. MEBiC08052]|nr:hypothetical protein VRK_01770 [Vibrio sp. MEBiC08052]